MMCFKDKTWCGDDSCKGECGFPYFTEKDSEAAEKWWGGPDAPVSFIMHDTPKEEK